MKPVLLASIAFLVGALFGARMALHIPRRSDPIEIVAKQSVENMSAAYRSVSDRDEDSKLTTSSLRRCAEENLRLRKKIWESQR